MIFVVIILAIVVTAYLASPKAAGPVSWLPVDTRQKTYVKPAHWKGTPIDGKGRFMNDRFPFYQDYLAILKWLPGHVLSLIRNRKFRSPVTYQRSAEALNSNEILVWLGHASFFLRINNTNILIDPHFNNTVIYRRHSDNPIPPDLFHNIDYILLSHDHADHCDKRSLQLLLKNNPQAVILSGLNMDKLVRSFSLDKLNIITAEWYEEFPLPGDLKIYFVPCRHYCKRIFQKFNGNLWGGFVIRYKHSSGDFHTIYYGGDSGYDNHFHDIKDLFKPDIAILPIGSYMPRWFMKPNHMSATEALQAFDDCGAGLMTPMHYGTFNLSNEDMDLPINTLTKYITPQKLVRLGIGEIFKVPD